jgi:hypothetical protein
MPQTGTQTTIKVAPSGITPTYNETVLVLESPNIQSDNFRWIFKLYKGVFGEAEYEIISTLVILPNPDGVGIIDVHRHIENYLSTDFYPSDINSVVTAVDGAGVKWSFEVTEEFQNPVWRFDDNTTAVGANVGFSTDASVNASYSNNQHPFVDGDEVSIVQDPGFTHPEYNTSSTILSYFNEYIVATDIPKESSTAIEGGLMTLVSGGTRTIEQDVALQGNIFFSFNGVLSFQGFRKWDATDYLMTNTSADTTKFLTNMPKTYDVSINDRVWLNANFSTGSVPALTYIVTDNGTYGVSTAYPPSNQFFLVQNKIGPLDFINTTDAGIIVLTGALPVVDANTTFIDYVMLNNYVDGPGVEVSETIRLNIVDDCSKYSPIRFFFMDKLGSYIPLTFNKVSRTNVKNDKSNYKQNYGNYDSVSETYGYTTYAKGTTTYDNVSTTSVTCTSDWLSDEQVDMVVEMLGSPNVYIQDENNEYIAINITTTSYEEKKRINDKLLNYTITFTYAQNGGSQRG